MSSSFQQNWIHSIRTSFAKVMGVLVFLSGSSPEMVRSLRSHRSLRPKGPGISGPVFFRHFMPKCGAPLLCARRYTGDGPESLVPPESPAQRTRNLQPCLLHRQSLRGAAESLACRSLRPSRFVSCVGRLWCLSGRRTEPGRNLRPRPEYPVHLDRSLRSEWPPTASFWGRL